MIDDLKIKRFRCFDDVRLNGLTRINVITGSNASGKSALLEAIYIGANASAHAVQNIAGMRGLVPLMITPINPFFPIASPQGSATLATYFDHLFRSIPKNGRVDAAKKIDIEYSDSRRVLHALGISYQVAGTEPAPVVRGFGGAFTAIPVIFDRRRVTGQVTEQNQVPISVNQFGQLQQPPAPPFGPVTFIFGADMSYAEVDNVTWFSQLKERNEADKVISFIRDEFPFVQDVEVLAPSGVNGLFAKMVDGTRRRVTTVSSGIYKIISILLATAHTREGIILIDEVENGIFYEKYPAVWRVLYKFARDTDNQIFVSSHSDECLRALPDVMGDADRDFCLIRTEAQKGKCIAQYINGTAMKAALRGGNEIRGATLGAESDNP